MASGRGARVRARATQGTPGARRAWILALTAGLGACSLSCSEGGGAAAPSAGQQSAPAPESSLAKASRAGLPDDLRGVALDMSEAQLKRARPGAQRQPQADGPEHYVFEEKRAQGGQILY